MADPVCKAIPGTKGDATVWQCDMDGIGFYPIPCKADGEGSANINKDHFRVGPHPTDSVPVCPKDPSVAKVLGDLPKVELDYRVFPKAEVAVATHGKIVEQLETYRFRYAELSDKQVELFRQKSELEWKCDELQRGIENNSDTSKLPALAQAQADLARVTAEWRKATSDAQVVQGKIAKLEKIEVAAKRDMDRALEANADIEGVRQ